MREGDQNKSIKKQEHLPLQCGIIADCVGRLLCSSIFPWYLNNFFFLHQMKMVPLECKCTASGETCVFAWITCSGIEEAIVKMQRLFWTPLLLCLSIHHKFSLSVPLQQGQVDCWPLPCPPVDCEFTVVPEGECCPRCVTDPCQADTIRNDITKTCTDEHNISRFSGSSWIKHGTECTLCQCKVNGR